MNCTKCLKNIDDDYGINFRSCPHLACLNCMKALCSTADRRTIRCIVNPESGPITCKGFLNFEELKWLLPEEDFNTFSSRVSPNAKEMFTGSSSSNSQDEYYETATVLTFKELDLSAEELQSGWGQISRMIIDLQGSGLSFEEANFHLDLIPVWPLYETSAAISCPICLDNIEDPQEGIILKECFHIFCRKCLSGYITHCETSEVLCPFPIDQQICSSNLRAKEVENLVPHEIYVRHYEELALEEAKKVKDAFQCLTPDCTGFCYFEETNPASTYFVCPKCNQRNCVTCKTIHSGSCFEYKRMLFEEENRLQLEKEDASNRLLQMQNDKKSEAMIQDHLNQRNFMRCPRCGIPCYKFVGCNHVTCGSCRHKFNWAGNEPRQFS